MSIEPSETPPKSRLLRTILWGTITAALAGLAIFWALDNYLGNRSKAVRYSGEADIRSEFSLIDHTGQEVTQADYADRWQLVFCLLAGLGTQPLIYIIARKRCARECPMLFA